MREGGVQWVCTVIKGGGGGGGGMRPSSFSLVAETHIAISVSLSTVVDHYTDLFHKTF